MAIGAIRRRPPSGRASSSRSPSRNPIGAPNRWGHYLSHRPSPGAASSRPGHAVTVGEGDLAEPHHVWPRTDPLANTSQNTPPYPTAGSASAASNAATSASSRSTASEQLRQTLLDRICNMRGLFEFC